MLKVKIIATGISVTILSASLGGCATNAETGATIGSVSGCALAIAVEKDPKKRALACLGGGVAGGAAGFFIGRQRDLDLARIAAQRIQASQPGVVGVQIRTQNLSVPPESRVQIDNVTTIESLDTMVVSVPVAQIQRMDPKAASTLSMVGKFVSDANTNSRVVVSAQTPQDYEYIVSSMQKGYGKVVPASKVAYLYKPMTRGTQATVEVSPAPMNIA